ncbi:MAG: hypothetical protein WCW53_11630 [Syntrophales bacterium]
MLPACVYSGAIFYLSSLWGLDKIINFIEYYIFGYLIFRCFVPPGEAALFGGARRTCGL